MELTAYWITSQQKSTYCNDPIGFGVTARSLEDAIRIINAFDYKLPEEYNVQENVDISALCADIGWVRENKGPHIIRGLWYPFVCLGVPKWADE